MFPPHDKKTVYCFPPVVSLIRSKLEILIFIWVGSVVITHLWRLDVLLSGENSDLYYTTGSSRGAPQGGCVIPYFLGVIPLAVSGVTGTYPNCSCTFQEKITKIIGSHNLPLGWCPPSMKSWICHCRISCVTLTFIMMPMDRCKSRINHLKNL